MVAWTHPSRYLEVSSDAILFSSRMWRFRSLSRFSSSVVRCASSWEGGREGVRVGERVGGGEARRGDGRRGREGRRGGK